MPNKDNFIVGLDIGTTKICAIVGQMAENGKINILGMGKSSSQGGVSKGMVSNVSKAVLAIEEAVSEAIRQSQVQIKSVFVAGAGLMGSGIAVSGRTTSISGNKACCAGCCDKPGN